MTDFSLAKIIGSNLNAKSKQLNIVLTTHFDTKQEDCRAECIKATAIDYAAGAKSPLKFLKGHPCGVLLFWNDDVWPIFSFKTPYRSYLKGHRTVSFLLLQISFKGRIYKLNIFFNHQVLVLFIIRF